MEKVDDGLFHDGHEAKNVIVLHKGRPRCWFHCCYLIDCKDGVGTCPDSGYRWSYKHLGIEDTKKKKSKVVNGELKEVEENEHEV